jgi:hypothetical protein
VDGELFSPLISDWHLGISFIVIGSFFGGISRKLEVLQNRFISLENCEEITRFCKTPFFLI